MPEWQGAGIGMRFLNAICQMHIDGNNRYGKKLPTYFHTSHPALCIGLRRDPKWAQVSRHFTAGINGIAEKVLQKVLKTKENKALKPVSADISGQFRDSNISAKEWSVVSDQWSVTTNSTPALTGQLTGGAKKCVMRIFLVVKKSFGLATYLMLEKRGDEIVGVAAAARRSRGRTDQVFGYADAYRVPVVSADKFES